MEQTFKVRRKAKKRVFQCTGYDQCLMTFTRLEHLARHIRKHTGERPFQCQYCQKFFLRLDNLRQHKQTVHAYEAGNETNMESGMEANPEEMRAEGERPPLPSRLLYYDPKLPPRPVYLTSPPPGSPLIRHFDLAYTTPTLLAFLLQLLIRSLFSSLTSLVISGARRWPESSTQNSPMVFSTPLAAPAKLLAYQQAQMAATGLPSICEARPVRSLQASFPSSLPGLQNWLRSVLNSEDRRLLMRSDILAGLHFSVNLDLKLYLGSRNRDSLASFGSRHLSDLMNGESSSARLLVKLPALSLLSLNLDFGRPLSTALRVSSVSSNPLSKKPTIENMLAPEEEFDFEKKAEPKAQPAQSSNIGVSYYGHISQPESMDVDEIDVDKVAAEAEEEFSRTQERYRNPNLPSYGV